MNHQTLQALGIDLGTRNTLVAAWGDPPSSLPLGEGEPAVPTCLARYQDEWLFGTPARQALEAGEGGNINIRYDLNSPLCDSNSDKEAWDIENAREWLVFLLKEAEYRLRYSEFALAITVPYPYVNPARKKLMQAARQTGVKHILLVHEPLACAAGWRLRNPIRELRKVVILTLGAGFTQAAAALVSPEEIRILTALNAPGWGGDQCDVLIGEEALEALSNQGAIKSAQIDYQDQIPFLSAVEKTRSLLSRRQTARLAAFLKGQKINFELSRDKMNGWLSPYIDQVETIAQKAHLALSLKADALLVAGRMAETPLLIDRLSSLFGKQPVLLPQETSALGAAWFSHAFFTDEEKASSAVMDALPYDIKLVIPKGDRTSLHSIISMNTSMDLSHETFFKPIFLASRSEPFGIEILQGESLESPHYRTRFEIPNVPSDAKGVKHVELNISIDPNGIFSCQFTDRLTKKSLPAIEILPKTALEEKILEQGTLPSPARAMPLASEQTPPPSKARREAPSPIPMRAPSCPKALLIKRSFASIEEILYQHQIEKEAIPPRGVSHEDFSWDAFALVVLTSASQFDRYIETIGQRLESFVKAGGSALILDWASIYIAKAFPGYMQFHEEPHGGMAAYIQATVVDPELEKITGNSLELDLSAGAWDPIKDLLRPEDVRVFLTGSYAIRNGFYQENKPLAVSFPYHQGRVVFSVLNEDTFSTPTGRKVLDFFLNYAMSHIY